MDDNSDLLTFLRERGISDETITFLQNENIDKNAIRALSEEKMKEIFPRFGDRIAIVEFCKDHQTSKKWSLIERLRQKIGLKEDTKKTETPTSFSKKATKATRIVELGWLDWNGSNFKQVRTRQGGGTRNKAVKKTNSMEDVKKIAEELFFENGKSSKGMLSKFNTKLLDFKHKELEMDLTVEEVYALTGLTRVRFYLATEKISSEISIKKTEKHKRKHDSINSDSDFEDSSVESYNVRVPETNDFWSPLTETSGSQLIDTANAASEIVRHVEISATPGHVEDSAAAAYIEIPTMDCNIVDLTGHYDFGGKNFILPTVPEDSEYFSINIKRENCVEEMFSLYQDCTITSKKLGISFVGEEGVDGGGLTREMFNLFFLKVESEYFRGEDVIVPFLPLNKVRKLKGNFIVIGRIIEHMILLTGSVPSKISRITFSLIKDPEHVIDDKLILEEFLLYVNPCERHLLHKALNNFSSLCEKEVDIIINIFNCYQFYELPNEHEIIDQIISIARDVLIEKTKSFIHLIRQGISLERYADLWTTCDFSVLLEIQRPTPTKVANCLICSSTLTNEETTVLHYLEMYIRCMDQDKLKKFLFFVTGSYQLPEAINIGFTKLQGTERRPLVHTCSNLLEISSQYSTYQDFKNEFDLFLINESSFAYTNC